MFIKVARTRPSALRAFAEKNGLELAAICFMGDDVNDLAAMELAGFSAAPANAQQAVRERAKHVTQRSGGHGAVRELVDLLLTQLPHPTP